MKKPFYKRFWFIALAVIVAINLLSSLGEIKRHIRRYENRVKKEEFEWSEMKLSALLPTPESNIGQIYSNTKEQLNIHVHKTTEDDYEEYMAACQDFGYNVECEEYNYSYDAFNTEGYCLRLSYDDDGALLRIILEAPIQLDIIAWPSNGLATLLPVPKSNIGKITAESSDSFRLYIGETAKEDYADYVNACIENGFSVDYTKSEAYFSAENAKEYDLTVTYEGNHIMYISLHKPIDADDEPSEPETTQDKESTSVAVQTESPSTESASSQTTATEPETTQPETEQPAALVDGMRPEFKEAMDSYEEFYNDYCEFMEDYMKNPSDLTLLSKYGEMMTDLVEMDAAFEEWGDSDLNEAEMKYYIEVQSRVAQKLVDVAY